MKRMESKVRMHMMQTFSYLENSMREAMAEVNSMILSAEADNYLREARMYLDEHNHRLVRRNGLSTRAQSCNVWRSLCRIRWCSPTQGFVVLFVDWITNVDYFYLCVYL